MAQGRVARALASQLACPTGIAGRALGAAMDIANRRPMLRSIDLLAPQDGERILDAGCGTGHALAQIRRRAACDLVGLDLSVDMAMSARRLLEPGVQIEIGPIYPLAELLGPFDAALALNVFYFTDPAAQLVASLRRSLRPGGRLVAYVTHRESMAGWSFSKAGLHRLFDAEELARLLEDGGFARAGISVDEAPVGAGVRGLFARAVR